jgi:cytochrome oxidase Cu insertion factor (SCO1/SenC/PrrC family)
VPIRSKLPWKQLVFGLTLLLGIGEMPHASEMISQPSANLYDQPGDWLDDHRQTLRLANWRGHMVMFTMALSTCRQVCSYALHRLEQLQNSAQRAGIAIDVVVASYDPTADRPETWSAYRRQHHLERSDWHFLIGSAADTEHLATALAFPSWLYDEHRIHDLKILLINSDGDVTRTLVWSNHNEDFFAGLPSKSRCSALGGC